MKENTILVGFDIAGKPYLLCACDTNYTNTKQDDKDFLLSDFENFNNWEEVLKVTGIPNTTKLYNFVIDGSWDYEHTEFDYDIVLTEVLNEHI